MKALLKKIMIVSVISIAALCLLTKNGVTENVGSPEGQSSTTFSTPVPTPTVSPTATVPPYETCPGPPPGYSIWDEGHSSFQRWTCRNCPEGQILDSIDIDSQGRQTKINCINDCPGGTNWGKDKVCQCPHGRTGSRCQAVCDSIRFTVDQKSERGIVGNNVDVIDGFDGTALYIPKYSSGISDKFIEDWKAIGGLCNRHRAELEVTRHCQSGGYDYNYSVAACYGRLLNVSYFRQGNTTWTSPHGMGIPALENPYGRYTTRGTCQNWGIAPAGNIWSCIAPGMQNNIPAEMCLGPSVQYFDKDGKPISGPVGTVCNIDALIYFSPISLLWDGQADLSAEIQVTDFKLDLNAASGARYAWRASAKQPLLVFDPEHKGNITDATQIFGADALGGKRSYLAKKEEGQASLVDTHWANGFEALATFDLDQDGRIKADELKDLGLWFDKNSDGVSQAGEVKDIREAGVLSLGYKVDAVGFNKRDLIVNKGFTKKENGKITFGKSVDWYAPQVANEEQLVTHATTKSIELGVNDLNFNEQKKTVALKDLPLVQIKDSKTQNFDGSKLNGSWSWTRKGSNSEQPEGLIVFSEQNGKLLGYSAAGYRIEEASVSGAESMLAVAPLNGEMLSNNTAKFSSALSNRSQLDSELIYDPKSDTLKGISKVALNHQGDNYLVRYEWVGKRLTR